MILELAGSSKTVFMGKLLREIWIWEDGRQAQVGTWKNLADALGLQRGNKRTLPGALEGSGFQKQN